MGDVADALKNIGLVVTTASGIGYACGYLVTRARAFALGTDPGFALVDQAYVWAGIRLAMLLLFAVLLSALPVLLLRAAWHLISHAAPRAAVAIERGMAVVAGGAIIVLAVQLFTVSNLIFEPSAATTGLSAAVLGRNGYGTLLFVGSTALLLVIGFWLRSRLARAGVDTQAQLLGVMGALLCVLLPIEHGVFFADRKVRQLDRIPEGATGVVPPVWIIDRGAGDRVVLFGRDGAGQPRLVPVQADKLDGIAVTAVADLGDILTRETHP